jgi:hypothetical protein
MRQQFWQLVVPIALRIKDKELADGLDATGELLKPISAKTRKYRKSAMTPDGKGDPDAPPLMPAYQKSRVRSLLAGRAFGTHCELYWRFDPFTGRSFDVILTYQVEMGRNVFGISDDGLRQIRIQSWAAWTKWKKTGSTPTERKSAFPAHALTQGPQPRIALIVARSTEPGAGSRATKAVGGLETSHLTLGIGAPTVERLKASTTRSGMMTGEEWRKYFTQEGKIRPGPAKAAVPKAPTPKAPVKPAPEVKSVPKPATIPVGTAIDIKTVSPKIGRAVKTVMDAIDKVHGDGTLPRIPLYKELQDAYLGSLSVNSDGTVRNMRINADGDHVHLTIAHETGHFLDYAGIPRTKPTFAEERDWRNEALFDDFFEAIENSESIKTLRERKNQTVVHVEGPAWLNNYTIDQGLVDYLLQDNEIWARSYAQWIAYRSGQDDMLAQIEYELSRTRQKVYAAQWNEADFRVIGQAMDAIFRGLGWLK